MSACAEPGKACRKEARKAFQTARRACKQSGLRPCRTCCVEGRAPAECLGAFLTSTTTTLDPSGTTSTTLPTGSAATCEPGTFVASLADQVFQIDEPACGSRIDLSLSPTRRVRVQVEGPDGEPFPSDSSILALRTERSVRPQGETWWRRSYDDGEEGEFVFHLTKGRYDIEIGSQGLGHAVMPKVVSVDVGDADVDLGTVALSAPDTVAMTGSISGMPGGQGLVSATWYFPSGAVGWTEIVPVFPDGDGNADFEVAVPRGVVRVVASGFAVDPPFLCGGYPAQRPYVGLWEGTVAAAIDVVVAMTPYVRAAGTVVGPDGEPREDVFVQAEVEAPQPFYNPTVCRSDAGGRFLTYVEPSRSYRWVANAGDAPEYVLRSGVSVGTDDVELGELTDRDACRVTGVGSAMGEDDETITLLEMLGVFQRRFCQSVIFGVISDGGGTMVPR